MRKSLPLKALGAILLAASAAGVAQTVPPPQSAAEALAQDAADYARRHRVGLDEALRRLRAQDDSVAVTDRLRAALGGRLAGISFEHQPQFRISVLLTGIEPVASQSQLAAGSPIPIVFRLGAGATREQIVAAMRRHQTALRNAMPNSRGMGLDPRSGELVLVVRSQDAAGSGAATIDTRAEALTGVPVRVDVADPPNADMIRGGARVEGVDPADGKRYACTTGFVVRNGTATGIVTAAHCPDTLVYREADGTLVPLQYVGQWGVGHQDVQLHTSSSAREPLFYADRRNGALRRLTGSRTLASTRAGETVCHWGESSGYSCSEIDLTDFAPPGDLCAGPCTPSWVTVRGASCRAGDSGGPVFRGGIAFGIAKGGSGLRGGCNFYYYMSTDYLPDGWSLLLDDGGSSRLASPLP